MAITSAVRTAAQRVISKGPARAMPLARAPARSMGHHNAPSFDPNAFGTAGPTATFVFVVVVPPVTVSLLYVTQMGKYAGSD